MVYARHSEQLYQFVFQLRLMRLLIHHVENPHPLSLNFALLPDKIIKLYFTIWLIIQIRFYNLKYN